MSLSTVMSTRSFTYEGYGSLLCAFHENGYQFSSFAEASEHLARRKRFVLMRHDIDFDLGKALRLAEVEAELGVSATYFFMLRTDHYNVLSRDGSEAVSRILALGHHLGLHFDCAAYPLDARTDDLAQACHREAGILQGWFDRPVSIVSYHRPNSRVLSGDPRLSAPLQHTYMPQFVQEICYRSDSRGTWSFGDPLQSSAFKHGLPLHVLVHPIWWHDLPATPCDTLERYVRRSSRALMQSVFKNCDIYRNCTPPAHED